MESLLDPPVGEPAPSSHDGRRGLAMIVLIVASFMDLLDATVVNVALPSIRHDLHASPAQLEWIVSGYMLAFAVLLVTGGRLGDVVGRRRVFLIGVAGFTLASLGAALAPDATVLIVGRVVEGAFAALMVPQVLSTLQALYRPAERAPIYGAVGAVSGLAAVVGPVLGGWLVTADIAGLRWRSVLLVNVPVGIALILAAARLVPESRSPRPLRLDPIGVTLTSAGVFGVVYPLVEGRQLGWPGWIWAVLAGGVAALGAFAVTQRRRQARDGSALLPMQLFANRGFSAGLVTQVAFQGGLLAFSLILTLYLQTGLRFSAIHAGLTFLPFSLGALLGTGLAVPLGPRLGRIVMFVGAGVQTGATIWAMLVVGSHGAGLDTWDLVAPMAISGVGLTLLVIPLIDVSLARVPLDQAGAASGTYSTLQQIGAALGIAVAGVVFFGHAGAHPGAVGLRHAFIAAGWVAVGGYAIAAAATVLLPSRHEVTAHMRAQEEALREDETPAVAAVT